MTAPNPDFDIDAYMHAHVLRSVTSSFWQVEADGTDIVLNTDTSTQLDPGEAIDLAASLIALAALAHHHEDDQEHAIQRSTQLTRIRATEILLQRHVDISEPVE